MRLYYQNKASKKVLEKSGLQKEGTLKQNRFLLNKYEDVDLYLYGLLKVEYISKKNFGITKKVFKEKSIK